jgi:L-iditol 2-dehydrogenase
MKMKSATLYGPKDCRVEEVDAPELRDDGVLIRVKVCGVCPSDVRNYTGAKKTAKYPMTTGHEWVGEIIRVGSRAEGFKIGDRVAPNWQVVCGMCRNCRRGLSNMCLTRFGPENAERLPSMRGGFCEIGWAVPEAMELIPENLSWEQASFTEPLACCYNGIASLPISVGDTVAIVGVGPIGQLLAQLARLRGTRVIALDLDQERLDLAKQLGASETILASDPNAAQQVLDLTDGYGADAVVVAVGSPKAEQSAFDMVCQGGCINFFAGTYPSATIAVDPNIIHYKQLWVTGSFHLTPDGFKRALSLLERGDIKVLPLVSHRLPLEQVADGFEIVANRLGKKVLIHCDDL